MVTSLLEFDDRTDPVRQASVAHLADIRGFLCELAAAAGAEDQQRFAVQWHILMKGAIAARHEGDADPALKAREMGVLLLAREGSRLARRAEWAIQDSNLGPLPYQRSALTD